jgi:hypothetical protein
MTNEERAGRAADALRDYRMEDDDFHSNVIDLLTDILHADVLTEETTTPEAAIEHLRAAFNMAEMNFEAEVKG